MSNSKIACLYYIPKLVGLGNSFDISSDIKICNSSNSYEAGAFFELVEKNRLVDVGDPSNYSLCIVFNKHLFAADFNEPYSLINRFTNILAINTTSPIVEGNVIETLNNFKSTKYLGQHYSFTHSKFEHFQDLFGVLDLNGLNDLKSMWSNYSSVWENEKASSRLSNALTFFYHAWNSQYMESFCINLSIFFELLFAPHAHSETSHQLSYNVSRFIAKNKDERESVYKVMKKFYSRRSSIIHGGLPNEEKIIEPTQNAFVLGSVILKSILLDPKLTEIFNDENQRKDLMKSFVFG